MTQEQVIRELRKLRYDRKPSIRSIAIEAGLDRKTLYNVMNTGCLSDATAASLARVLQRANSPAYQKRRSGGL